MNEADKRINKLRHKMAEADVSMVLIPTSDCHLSEYVSPYFKVREFYSGFTGSYGTLVVTGDEAFLFTDGRYFIQAQKELSGSGIKLMRIGEKGVPKLIDFVCERIKEGEIIGFDGMLIGAEWALKLKNRLKDRGLRIDYGFDPADGIWEERPYLISNPLFNVPLSICGETTKSKLSRIREKLKKEGCDTHIITTLDDIAWIMNARGSDIEYCPLFYSYMIITENETLLYTDADASALTKAYEENEGLSDIVIKPYKEFITDGISYLSKNTKKGLMLDMSKVSCTVYMKLADGLKIKDMPAPSEKMKAIKNESEIKADKKAHIKDGIAILRLMKWLDERNGDYEGLSELTVAEKVLELRKEQEGFIEPSFETISAYGENGAVVHYAPTKETDAQLKGGSFLLVDSGGHYTDGTTDITRTFLLGRAEDEAKHDYTLVLRAMLRLLNTKFLYGARSCNLDMTVRELFWEKGLDYKHGTGHGVGFLMNVHEGPNSIRWKIDPDKIADDIFEEGMITSDEPGLYFEGKYGIRLENEILCKRLFENEYGIFMGFESLTYAPLDMKAVAFDDMDKKDIENLNRYNALVYEKLSPCLSGDELSYLRELTKEVFYEP